jgi:DNA-binding NtrC family response regulator
VNQKYKAIDTLALIQHGRELGKVPEKEKHLRLPVTKVHRGDYRSSAIGQALRRRVLSVSALAADHQALRHALNDQVWQVEEAANYQEAIARLRCDRMHVVLCGSHLPDGSWKDLLSQIAAIPDPPALIVSSGAPDEHLCAEVHNLGGYSVLVRPFKGEEVRQMLALAYSTRTVQTGAPSSL